MTTHLVKDHQILHVSGVKITARRQMIGTAPEGGRHEYQGPVDPDPFAFTFPMATVIDNFGGSAAEDQRVGYLEVAPGDRFIVEGIPGTWELHAPARWDGDYCKLRKVEEQA